MLNTREFTAMKEELAAEDERREEIIKSSRDVLKLAKQLIYAIHRNDKNTGRLGKELQEQKRRLDALAQGNDHDEGASSAAAQEYAEAMVFLVFRSKGTLPSRKEIGVATEDYLAGIADFTGEMVRFATNSIIAGNQEQAANATALVEELYGQFLQFDFRNGLLRKKSDSIKYNLQRLEEMMYDTRKR
ncbi:hypothetical protein HY491_02110 [Candidatus Woesearchaeota archaeon]|nr:hypothetical protein [Candidatus Woesearchaeota archaeon]